MMVSRIEQWFVDHGYLVPKSLVEKTFTEEEIVSSIEKDQLHLLGQQYLWLPVHFTSSGIGLARKKFVELKVVLEIFGLFDQKQRNLLLNLQEIMEKNQLYIDPKPEQLSMKKQEKLTLDEHVKILIENEPYKEWTSAELTEAVVKRGYKPTPWTQNRISKILTKMLKSGSIRKTKNWVYVLT